MLEGITHETRATLEFMSYGGLCSIDVDGMWDLFKPLAWYQWHHEIASASFVCLSHISYDFQAYSPLVCSYYQSFDHDVNSYPYYDVSNKCYARLDAMTGIMNEQH